MTMTTIKKITDRWNNRQLMLMYMIVLCCLLMSLVIIGLVSHPDNILTNLSIKNLAPSVRYPFGTDWLGRDMFRRTLLGLSVSVRIGLVGAIGSTLVAVVLGMCAATMGPIADQCISWLIDLFLSVPHLVTLILVSFMLGGGMKGVVVGVVVTHWPTLARLVRAEVMQVRSHEYVLISYKLGKSKWWVATHHIFPHIVPQIIIGFMLLFPHAILHESAITFLGLGLSPHKPSIGIILSESMKYLTAGRWWLAFFPGLSLLCVVRMFDRIGEGIKQFVDPTSYHT